MKGPEDEGQEPQAPLLLLPVATADASSSAEQSDGQEGGDDIVWFDPEVLAQRSEIGNMVRRPGWWCPEDLDPTRDGQTPCWGALQPSLGNLDKGSERASPLWNHPSLPLVQRWSRTPSLCITAQARAPAYALLDQMLESLVVSNLFEREPEPHRALLVTQRAPQAWWHELTRRWQHTRTPEGHRICAHHPDFAGQWLLVSWEVWQKDREELQAWLMAANCQKVLAFHLPQAAPKLGWVAQAAQRWALRSGIKYLIAGHADDLGMGWDPRDRMRLELRAPHQYALCWEGFSEGMPLSWDPDCCAYVL